MRCGLLHIQKYLTETPSTPPYDPQTRALVQTPICSEESATLEAKMAARFCVFIFYLSARNMPSFFGARQTSTSLFITLCTGLLLGSGDTLNVIHLI